MELEAKVPGAGKRKRERAGGSKKRWSEVERHRGPFTEEGRRRVAKMRKRNRRKRFQE